MTGGRRPAVLSVALLATGLVVLAAGRFIRFDDTSGFGSSDRIFELGILAVVPAVAAVIVASANIQARVWLGAALMGLAALLVLLGVALPGFRFVWTDSQVELRLLEAVLALTAAVLLATGLQPARRRSAAAALGTDQPAGRWIVRGASYAVGAFALMIVTFFVVVLVYDAEYCGAGGETECLASLAGMLWAMGSLLVSGVVIAVTELVLWRRRNRRARG
ncbi:hypothetical protein E1218_32190 [Kribbella turkmenica]|uniref:Uncharacterized protein n=1 Tax=Kribbella turkmenica TaxID=2530375 RepID=A0A4R4WCU5_9ACTN|nr:hypothetical protein [Kribbella turkmenica]TDD15027.1 hypothetical protein E1218_32190 [Kribbella turkmenica]